MKISISNIGWKEINEEQVLLYLKKQKFDAIEVAPTKIIKQNPYDNIDCAKDYLNNLKEKYNLVICSIQSIWYGITRNIFNKYDIDFLTKYTFKSIDFAASINCSNIVFGCPKNRNKANENISNQLAIDFFNKISDYALKKNVIIALEPNPKIYGTNFINTTSEAIEFVKKLNKPNIKVNVDFGTIIQNSEELDIIFNNIKYVNHIHISEPNLVKIKRRTIHKKFLKEVCKLGYNNYVSIEMKQTDIKDILETIDYLVEIRNEIQ